MSHVRYAEKFSSVANVRYSCKIYAVGLPIEELLEYVRLLGILRYRGLLVAWNEDFDPADEAQGWLKLVESFFQP